MSNPLPKTKQQKQGSFVQFVLDEMMAISPDTLNPFAPPRFLILTGGKSKTTPPPLPDVKVLYTCASLPLSMLSVPCSLV